MIAAIFGLINTQNYNFSMKTAPLACLMLLVSPVASAPPARARAYAAAIDEVKGAALLAALDNASFAMSANVYNGDESEEVAVIANAPFHLLRRDLVETLKSEKFEFDDDDADAKQSSDERYLEATARAFLPSEREDAEWVEILVTAAIAKHRAASFKTDEQGNARTKQIKPGEYYLFGLGRSGVQILVWHLPIRIEPGENRIELDQHNAAAVFAAGD